MPEEQDKFEFQRGTLTFNMSGVNHKSSTNVSFAHVVAKPTAADIKVMKDVLEVITTGIVEAVYFKPVSAVDVD